MQLKKGDNFLYNLIGCFCKLNILFIISSKSNALLDYVQADLAEKETQQSLEDLFSLIFRHTVMCQWGGRGEWGDEAMYIKKNGI